MSSCKKVAPAATFSYSTVGDRDAQYAEFTKTTDGRLFAKEFRTSQEAIIGDPLETNGARVLAWIKRRSWGNYCLYCVSDSGSLVFQGDCAADLGLNPGSVSKIVSYYVDRGHVARIGVAKILSPVVAPQLGPAPDRLDNDLDFQAFFENWKVAAGATIALQLEDAILARKANDVLVRKLKKVIAGEYEKSLQQQQTEPVSIYKIPEDVKTPNADPDPAPDPLSIRNESSSSGLFVVPAAEPTTTTTVSEIEIPGPTDPLPPAIHAAFRKCVRSDFSRRTALSLVAAARDLARERGEPLSDEDIEGCILDAWECAHRKVGVIGFYNTALPEKIEALFERRQRERDAASDSISDEQLARALADREELEKAFAAEMSKPL